ncbi:MAG: cache domain-containing protein [Telluria sp.]
MRKPLAFAAALFLLAGTQAAVASEPSEKDAIAMAERAAAYMKGNGKDALAKRITAKDPQFIQGTLYVDMRDAKTGVVLAHPVNPTIVGVDLLNVPDANGKLYRKEILQVAQKDGKGWVDYMYRNPETKKIEPKTTYILRVNDVVLEAGIYKK